MIPKIIIIYVAGMSFSCFLHLISNKNTDRIIESLVWPLLVIELGLNVIKRIFNG